MSPPRLPSIVSAPRPPLIVSPAVAVSVAIMLSAPLPPVIVNAESFSALASNVNTPAIPAALIVPPVTVWKLASARVAVTLFVLAISI